MSEPPKKRQPKTETPPPSEEEQPEAGVAPFDSGFPGSSAVRIRFNAAICRLMQQVPTSVEIMLSQYLGKATPRLGGRGESAFPRPVRRHPNYEHRYETSQRYDLLLSYLGDFVLAYIEVCEGADSSYMMDRLAQIEDFAERNIRNFVPEGSERHGYVLEHVTSA